MIGISESLDNPNEIKDPKWYFKSTLYYIKGRLDKADHRSCDWLHDDYKIVGIKMYNTEKQAREALSKFGLPQQYEIRKIEVEL